MSDPVDVACRTKVPYATKSQAKKALKVMRSRGSRSMVLYKCWNCGLFHLGNRRGQQTYIRKGRVFE